MLATGKREQYQTTLEKTEQYGTMSQQGSGWVSSVKVRNVAPMTKKDEEKIQGLVCNYLEQQLRHDFLKNRVDQLEKQNEERQKKIEERQKKIEERQKKIEGINRGAVIKVLSSIFKTTERELKAIFSQEQLDKLGFDDSNITIAADGMSSVIVAYLKEHPIQALDLRNFDLKNGVLETLFSSLPETKVRSICLARQLSPDEEISKEKAEKTLEGLGRTLRIVIK